jgi:ubiquinone/menaquinone biosynthesis C-methylase UbiE
VASAEPYEHRTPHHPSGIGKLYLGREIARVMGPEGIARLDRPARKSEEPPAIVIEALGLQPGQIVADVGAGTGYYTFELARAVGPRGTVLAVEIEGAMLAALRKRAAELNATNVGLVRATPSDPRLPPARIDVVLMVHVYHELEFPYEVMQALVRSLKPEGRVAIVEHRAEAEDSAVGALHAMSEAQIVKEMRAAGLELERKSDALPGQHIVIFRKAARGED